MQQLSSNPQPEALDSGPRTYLGPLDSGQSAATGRKRETLEESRYVALLRNCKLAKQQRLSWRHHGLGVL